jgi:exodeoxyribonuclease VII small subunit
MSKSKNDIPFNFEATMLELATLVQDMENGQLDLETTLKQFEQGMQLTKQCQQALQAAEQKVQILMEKQGKEILENFDETT